MEHYPDYEKVAYHLVYAELINAARQRGTVTYQELAHVVGLPTSGNHMGKRIGELLGAVALNEVQQGRPMLSAVAVRASGEAGPGFYTLAKELELFKDGDDPIAFWQKHLNASYDTWKQQFPKK